MIRPRYNHAIALLGVMILLAFTAGSFSPVVGQSVATVSAQTATVTNPSGLSVLEPASGLADLISYQATLTMSFKGKESGQASQWTQTLVSAFNGKPLARTLTATFKGKAPAADYIAPWSAEKDGVFYWSGTDGKCVAVPINETPSDLSPHLWEPADFLLVVSGAADAGSKKVNTIVAKGYKFDERTLGLAGRAKAAGEVWIAEKGGYVLKYTLTLTGGSEYFGEGSDGTLTWAYDVTKVDQPVTIVLPKDCPAGMVDIVMMDNARNVKRHPGMTMYLADASVAKVTEFYQKAMSTQGWKLDGTPMITEKMATLNFKQGTSQLTVIITSGREGTMVQLFR